MSFINRETSNNKIPDRKAFKLRQQGVALISVLLVFAIAAVIASEVVSRNLRDIRKTTNLIDSKQAYHFAIAGEQYAKQLLFRDYDTATRSGLSIVDKYSDIWADDFQPFNIDNGSMTIEIHDLQARFNLNNLVNSDGSLHPNSIEHFRKLQQTLDLENDYSETLLDWQDADAEERAGGGEDSLYGEDYLAANRHLADKSELRLLYAMSAEDYFKLKDHVVALPKVVAKKSIDRTKYNMNTVDAKLLEAIGSYNTREVQSIVSQQKAGGFDSVSEWLSQPEVSRLSSIESSLDIRSEFFEIVVSANYQQRLSIIRTQIYRNAEDGKLTVLKRQQGTE